MKKILISVLMLCSILGLTFAQDSNQDVVSWLHSNGLTKYSSASSFRPYDSITRGEAAKFMVEYAQMQQMPKIKSPSECWFKDIENYDDTLQPFIVEVCQYGIFQGNNGYFYPNNNITKGEAIAVTLRTQYGLLSEQSNPWYLSYYNKAVSLGISAGNKNGYDNFISRIEMGRWLKEIFDIHHNKSTTLSTPYSTITIPQSEILIKAYSTNTIGIIPYETFASEYMYQLDVAPSRSIKTIKNSLNEMSSNQKDVILGQFNGVQWYEGGMGYNGKVEIVGNNANYIFTIFGSTQGTFEEGNEEIAMQQFFERIKGFKEN